MKNVPKLRFKEFTNEWEENKLSNLSELIKDGTHGTHENVENGVVLLSAKDIKNGKIQIQKDCRKISLDDFQKIHKNYTLQNDDLLLSIVGTIGEVGIIKNYNNNYTFQRSVGIIRLKKQKLNPSYCFQYFKTEIFQNILKNKANSSAQSGVYLGELSKININFSSLQEQQKIADFLSSVDTKISLTEEKLENLKIYKKGIVQKIFSQEIRFKDKNGNDYPEWEEKKLEDISEIYQPKTISQEEMTEKGYCVYGANGIIGKYHSYNHENSQIAVTCRGNTCGTVNFTKEKSWITGNAMVINTDKFKEMNKKYLYFILLHSNLKYLITGSGQPQITSEIKNHKIKISILEEQQKIADFLSSIDNKIEKTEKKLNELKEFKKDYCRKCLYRRYTIKEIL